ncbi:MAG: ATP-binding protein [Clostridia bacterium]
MNRCIIGDYSRVIQIMINLGTNAIKYTPHGGFVEVRVCEKENPDPDAVTYEFLCRDNGIGMSPELLEHVFEPFVRGVRNGGEGHPRIRSRHVDSEKDHGRAWRRDTYKQYGGCRHVCDG